MNEKDFLQKIKDSAQNITPPDSLSPEEMEKKLKNMKSVPEQDENTIEFDREIKKDKDRQTRKAAGRSKKARFAARFAASAAAVFVLAFVAIGLGGRISRNESDSGSIESAEITIDNVEVSSDSDEVNADSDDVRADNDINTTSDDSNDSDSISGSTNDSNASSYAASTVSEDPFTYASSYEEIYEALAAANASNNVARALGGIMTIEDSGGTAEYDGEVAYEMGADSADTASSDSSVSANYSGSSDSSASSSEEEAEYSTTNTQVAGVDEGDIVKTDGSWLYILRTDGEFLIVSVDGSDNTDSTDDAAGTDGTYDAAGTDDMDGKLALVSQTTLEGAENPIAKELYLDGDTLCVITREYTTSLTENEDGSYETKSVTLTVLYTYDVSDRSHPVLTGKVTQEGFYSDSRKVGNAIYLFSIWYPSIGDSLDDSELSPLLNGAKAEAADYYLPETMSNTECLIISSVDITNPSEFLDNKILVSGADNFYVSEENIYIVNENYEHSNTVSEITKFHYENGTITGVAAGSVTGYLNDSFSMSEYDGNLRLVTTYYGDDLSPTASVTDWTEHNALYILDASMSQLSVLSNLAEDETVRSARFLGETGYFVTFRQTDPLFSVDLSDPENPQILGELKISGFSSYLHFYGDGLLLGLGYEADESTGNTTGLKLSMFDISDPSNVTEAAKYVIDGVTWCDSLENYKSILVDADKNLIGFYCDNRYLLFSYSEEDGFVQEMIYDFYTDQLAGEAESSSMRGLYINDTLYLVGSTFVISFDMNNAFEKTQVLTIE
ncbi:MAG: beta-propeller domain-containing protein [Lachnospiraceae bacterium]|nr:beta-propeller domain-containing protein [Lachnospiraceae bacterium]